MSKLLSLIVTLVALSSVTHSRILAKNTVKPGSKETDPNPKSNDVANNDDSRPAECKKELLELMSLKGEKLSDPQVSSPMVESYCRRNENTCCTEKNIQSANATFATGVQKLRNKFAVIEETLSLFRGPRFVEIAEMFEKREECTAHVAALGVTIEGNEYNFFSMTTQQIFKDKVSNLLLEVESYLKKISWFHGNSLCSFCNPLEQQFYDIRENESIFSINPSTCYEIMEEHLFEQHLMGLYEEYIVPIVKYIECGLKEEPEDSPDIEKAESKVDSKTESKAESNTSDIAVDETDEYLIMPLDAQIVAEFNKNVKECQMDLDVDLENCQKFCTRNWRVYAFPETTIFRNFQVALKVLFEALTEQKIVNYYLQIRGIEWKLGAYDGPVVFYEQNDFISRYNADTPIWEFDNRGSIVYRQIMAKKFINFQVASVASIWAGLGAIVLALLL